MELVTLQSLLKGPAIDLRRALIAEHNSRYNPIDFLNYDPHTHRIITDRIHRRDKIVYYEIPNEYDSLGNPAMAFKVVPVTRLAVAFQKEIVDTAVSFSVGGKISLKCNPKQPEEVAVYDGVTEIWRENKMSFRVKDIARRQYSETECAVIIYASQDEDGGIEDSGVALKTRLVSPAQGDTLYPLFNGLDDMIGFGIEYLTSDYRVALDIYTKDVLYKFRDVGVSGGFVKISELPLRYGKIPVAYFNQDESEWRKVQHLIERYEVSLSNLCDTNDYNGSPILFSRGIIKGFSDKGETGKIVEGEGDNADLKYLSWDNAPESIKLELNTLVQEIRVKTRTVDLSPEAIKGMGSAPSGVAFDRMLIGPHMKGQDKRDGSLGEGLQRIVNIFKSSYVLLINPGAIELTLNQILICSALTILTNELLQWQKLCQEQRLFQWKLLLVI
ncbi:MAG: phage portal protein [Bacteroidota bacterium]